MAVYINYKICDNANECSGIEVCVNEALYWDILKETLRTDNSKCISCDACISVCPAGAILVAHSDQEAKEIERDIENDPRTIADLMVERYGASPIDDSTLISINEMMKKIQNDSTVIAIEVFNDEDAPCLINSVPIAELFSDKIYEYYKVTINDADYTAFSERFNISDCPTLLVFKDRKLLTRIDGEVDNGDYHQRSELIKKIRLAIH